MGSFPLFETIERVVVRDHVAPARGDRSPVVGVFQAEVNRARLACRVAEQICTSATMGGCEESAMTRFERSVNDQMNSRFKSLAWPRKSASALAKRRRASPAGRVAPSMTSWSACALLWPRVELKIRVPRTSMFRLTAFLGSQGVPSILQSGPASQPPGNDSYLAPRSHVPSWRTHEIRRARGLS